MWRTLILQPRYSSSIRLHLYGSEDAVHESSRVRSGLNADFKN